MSVIVISFLQHCYISMLSLLLEHLLFHPCRRSCSANLPGLEGLEGWKAGGLGSQRSLEADLSHEKGTLLKESLTLASQGKWRLPETLNG